MASKEEKTEMEKGKEEEKPAEAAAEAAKTKEEEGTAASTEAKEGMAGEVTEVAEGGGGAAAAASVGSTGGESKPPSSPQRQAAAPDDDRGRRVYVGNLAWEVKSEDLKEHVESIGALTVVRATVMQTPDGRSKGCGIVELSSKEDAQRAVAECNDTELRGRQIFVREDREDYSRGGGGGGAAGGYHSGGGGGYHHHGGGGGGGGHRFSAGETAQNRRVYVGNLSWDVAWQDLKDHMREAGTVVHAEVITEHTGRSKGCGIVEYATEEEAANAIATLTDTELKGRMIFVREDRESSNAGGGGGGGYHHGGGGRGAGAGGNSSVYVWNLAPETSWQDLKDHMRKAGNVDSATILTNAAGESICCGVVAYQRPQEAARAIRELQNSDLNGRPLYVREDRVAGGGGGRGGGGRGYYHHGGRGGGRGGGRYEEGTQLYVGNLSFETTWRELKDHFRQCGDVRRAEVITGPGGQSRGFGTVQFYQKKDAEAAIQRLNGSELQGRELEVRVDLKAR